MTSRSPASAAVQPTSDCPPAEVWDHLWRHAPSTSRDDALLDRERRGPRWRFVVERLEETFGRIAGLRVVELGSGRGDLSVLLAERGALVTLFDASDQALRQARIRFDRLGLSAEFARGDLLGGLDEYRGRFDLALSSGVIEHFRGADRTHALRAHRRVLCEGGAAIVSVPNAWCAPYRLWKFYLELRGWWPYGLELPYSKTELLRRARRVGFERVEARCLGFWQSVGDHWGRSLLGRGPDWVDRPSLLDRNMGMSVVLFGRRGRPAESEGTE